MSIKQLLLQHIPFLNIYIVAIYLGACVWLHWTIIKGCCNNTNCTVSLQHLKLRTYLNTVLRAVAFCPQTSITNVEYLTFQRPLATGNTLTVPYSVIALPFVELIHVLLPLGFGKMQTFFKIFSIMANWLRNAFLILHYPRVICRVFCSYIGTVLTNNNEVIQDNLKRITNEKNAQCSVFLYLRVQPY